MLGDKFNTSKLKELFVATKDWEPFPKASNRVEWDQLVEKPVNQFRKTNMIERAEKHLDQEWAVLPAHLYMEFVINGNRHNFETVYFNRRSKFTELVMAECFEYQGRFIDDILNGFWAILEETSWCLPAHHGKWEGDPMPDSNEEVADLFACQTANIIAEAYYLLKEKLYEISPNLCLRIKKEVKRRVLNIFTTNHGIGWADGHNNWAIWCSSNVLGAAMYTIDDVEELAVLTVKLIEVFDRYYNKFEDDGGCDEGPGYWSVSPGIMTMFLEYLRDRSAGEINIYDDPKIKRMANFIEDAHISKNYYINFADAGAKTSPTRGLTYRLGEMTKQNNMMRLTQHHALRWGENKKAHELPLNSDVLNLALRDLFWFEASSDPVPLEKDKRIWYPNTQILICRESSSADKGLFCAMKAGHNGENHNHNDIGHFILYSEGRPSIIDVGVETYSKVTFGPERYTLTYMRSAGHNIPTINGCEQLPNDKFRGPEYSSDQVEHTYDETSSQLKMNLEGAYGEESQLKSYQRSLQFFHDEGKSIVTDTFDFKQDSNEIDINFYCQSKPIVESGGVIKLLSSPDLKMKVSDDNMVITITEVPVTDQRLLSSWSNPLYKINGKLKNVASSYSISYEFS